MNLQQLRYVKALVEEGSFVGAASRCAVTQPTLSNGIAQLEVELGSRLFRRTTRSVRLTPYGEHILPNIIEVLRAFDELTAVSKSAALKAPTVHVGFSPIIGIRRTEQILSRFRAKHPDVEIVFRESNFRELYDLLRRRQLDLILCPCDSNVALDAEYVRLAIESDPLVFVPRASAKAQWANIESVTPGDIASETFVLVPDGCGLSCATHKIFEANKLGLRRYSGEASSYAAVIEWANRDLGSGILPISKLEGEQAAYVPLIQNGHPIVIDYFALGKPSTVSAALFSRLWDSLLEAKVMVRSAAGESALNGAGSHLAGTSP